ncbi:NMD3-related protein [Nanoarchaeota archaeon]
MTNRFCPKCGKKGIKGDFCSDCYKEESRLEFRNVDVTKCIYCDRFMFKNTWKLKSVDEGIIETALIKIRNPKRLKLDIVPIYDELKDKPGAEQDIELRITVEGQEFVLPSKLKFTICPRCSKVGTQYFEGALQFRNVTPEFEKYIKEELELAFDKGVHVAKEVRGKNVWDLYMTNKRWMRQLVKRLQKRFNGELKESAQLYTHNKETSKDVFRLNILFRLRDFKIGDIVEVKGKKVKITTIGRRVSGTDVETGKKVFVK